MKKLCLIFMVLCLTCITLAGCTEVSKVSKNLSMEADNFNLSRRLTVFNVRTDTILFQMTGNFSIETDEADGQLEITCEIENGRYSKHFVRLSDEITYIIEDLNGADVSKYSYELNFLPKAIPGVKIVSKE